MLLKKQTVWLLTMLSLVVVLSVYYITTPEQKSNDLAAVEEKANEETAGAEESSAEETASEDGETVISGVSSDEMFETLRMQMEDERSRMEEELTNVMASTDLSAEERNEAKEKIDQLRDVAQKEILLETVIKAMDYEDVLVRADGEKVRITIKSKEHSPTAANEIIQMVKGEIPQLQVASVEFEPGK
ncbi:MULTISPECIES: SpoIIIAH-like family protein [Bacillaceae]|uniref:Stage III sporulation protein AH n=2 Tax=Bacillus infantis TaxID=324767 RepID=U5LC78_9BACI|nr:MULTISPECIES: SpoIIIAH-like family protein [Bacillus]OXT19169.1 stage III sporulation protein AH [Bacillus sp. OG2]AGX05454.1 stage III sporulation protein AH [Bacillus infantis NRRL B-14911]EAR65215.1 stage III sporulation protein AH [Bacillus sp. NRRL B-14911]MCA1036170.1 SpoIIIAH-like family protein [Bacillus infantis]MCK6204483.1 SpoIIIAH-like family protein [Bacillus infantis]